MADWRQDRRERRRRQIRRRRLLVAGTLIAAVVAIAAVALSATGSGSKPDRSDRGRDLNRLATQKSTAPSEPRSNWEPHTGPVPILEYHVLGAAPADAPYPDLYVRRPDFHRQMDWLEEHGYEAVSLEQVEDAWHHGGTLPPKPVVLSFDDGYRPDFTYALPELRRHGWAGVLNLKAEGSDLYRSNVEAMIAAGWELAAHTIHHLDLTALDAAQLREEVAGSRQLLRREYGVPVDDFCYPSGQFDETVIAAVKAAGYTGATTEIPGYASRQSPYELARFEILGSGGVAGMVEDLGEGGSGVPRSDKRRPN